MLSGFQVVGWFWARVCRFGLRDFGSSNSGFCADPLNFKTLKP